MEGLKPCAGRSGVGYLEHVQPNRIPMEGLKPVVSGVAPEGEVGSTEQNPDGGIETARICPTSAGRYGSTEQNPDGGIETSVSALGMPVLCWFNRTESRWRD